MAYLYLNDDYPESADYDNNYLLYDGSCTTTAKEINEIVSSESSTDPIARNNLKNICDASLAIKKTSLRKKIFKKIRRMHRKRLYQKYNKQPALFYMKPTLFRHDCFY